MLGNITGLLGGAVAIGDYESIATVTVGAGGSSMIDFTSIPSTYTHLQIRGINQTNRATYTIDNLNLLVGNGSIDTATNYSTHSLYSDYANGSTVYAEGTANASNGLVMYTTTGVANAFGALVIDILDYANTSKYKTFRSLSGADANGTVSGYNPSVGLSSGSWRNTAAITNIRLKPFTGTSFNQYSTIELYGIKG